MGTRAIPCVLMRGGTSRGPYFLASDLPSDPAARDEVLLQVMGSGHELQVDGIGGGHPLTSKVAIVSPSRVPGADVDYLFAQVNVKERFVDTSPNRSRRYCSDRCSSRANVAAYRARQRAAAGENAGATS